MAITPVNPGVTTSAGVTASIYTFFGLPLSDWVTVATLLFICVQMFVYTPKVWNTGKAWYRKIFKKDSSLFDELSETPLEKDTDVT